MPNDKHKKAGTCPALWVSWLGGLGLAESEYVAIAIPLPVENLVQLPRLEIYE